MHHNACGVKDDDDGVREEELVDHNNREFRSQGVEEEQRSWTVTWRRKCASGGGGDGYIVPEQLEDAESCQLQCDLQAWAVAARGDGKGAEKMEDPPSLSILPLLLFLLSPNFTTRRGGGTCDNVDGDQIETWCVQFYR